MSDQIVDRRRVRSQSNIRCCDVLCGPLLKLPKVCLQTGKIEDLVECGSVIFARPAWLWKVQIGVGCIAMALFGLAFFLMLHLDGISFSSWSGKMSCYGSGCHIVMAVLPWYFFKSPIRLHRYLSRRRRSVSLPAGFFTFATLLPILIIFVGFTNRSAPWSIPTMFFFDSWWPVAIFFGAIATWNMLRQLLEWHWRTSRTRGLAFRAMLIDNRLFAVSGFTPEFLSQISSQQKD